MNELEKSILKTIIYFDIFNYPLISSEIHNWLIDYKCELKDVVFCLSDSENVKRYVESRDGFYFLRGRKDIIKNRKINRLNSQFKIRLVLKKANFIKYIPFVKCVCLSGSIPYFNSSKDADIDLFIIIKDRYLWLSRFLVTMFAHIYGVRRHGKKIKNRLCLNFYITDKNYNLKELCYENELWFFLWFTQIFPILGKDEYRKFLTENSWILDRLPNYQEFNIIEEAMLSETYFSTGFKKFFEVILNNDFGMFLDFLAGRIQVLKMSFNKHSKRNNGEKDVIVSDEMLKFHEADPRKYYNNLFLEKTKFLL